MEPSITTDRDAALLQAIENTGGAAELARALDCSTQAISQWRRVPAERVLAVEKASGVSRYLLRPDIYGAAPDAATAILASQGAPSEEPTAP